MATKEQLHMFTCELHMLLAKYNASIELDFCKEIVLALNTNQRVSVNSGLERIDCFNIPHVIEDMRNQK